MMKQFQKTVPSPLFRQNTATSQHPVSLLFLQQHRNQLRTVILIGDDSFDCEEWSVGDQDRSVNSGCAPIKAYAYHTGSNGSSRDLLFPSSLPAYFSIATSP